MLSWRLNWAMAEVFSRSSHSKHSRALISPWKFWLALALKFVPHLWPFPIRLRLRNGGTFMVRDFMTLYIYREVFVDGCYDIELQAAAPVIIDVGSNTGLFIARMKQLYPESRILGFEPMPENFAQLKRNIELSGYTGCEIFRQGVGATARTERLYVHSHNIGGHSIYRNQTPGDNYVEIDLASLDEVVKRLNGTPCDLLKLDCEGAEYEIIMSIDREAAGVIRKIIIETTPSLYDPDEMARHLESVGYQLDRHHGLWLASLQDVT